MNRAFAVIAVVVAGLWSGAAMAGSVVADYRDNDGIVGTEIGYANGDVRLAATLLLPANRAARVSAVVIQGSGRSGRENVWAGMIAQILVANGVAVVFPDKRGAGASGGDLGTSAFLDLAGDAYAAVRYLRAHPELGAPVETIGLVGLSQGGHVAPVVAAQYPDEIGFVINVSGGATTGIEALRHERVNTYRELGIEGAWLARFNACDGIVDELLLGGGDLDAYLACAAGFAGGPYGDLAAAIYPMDPGDWRFNWFPQLARFDPLPYWRQVGQPVLIAYGADDEFENVPVARSVGLLEDAFAASGHTDHTIRVYPGVGHGLWRREDGRTPVFDGAFLDDLEDWVRRRVAN